MTTWQWGQPGAVGPPIVGEVKWCVRTPDRCGDDGGTLTRPSPHPALALFRLPAPPGCRAWRPTGTGWRRSWGGPREEALRGPVRGLELALQQERGLGPRGASAAARMPPPGKGAEGARRRAGAVRGPQTPASASSSAPPSHLGSWRRGRRRNGVAHRAEDPEQRACREQKGARGAAWGGQGLSCGLCLQVGLGQAGRSLEMSGRGLSDRAGPVQDGGGLVRGEGYRVEGA